MPTIFGPLTRWELLNSARKPWVYLVRSLYALALLMVLGAGWPNDDESVSRSAAFGESLSRHLLALHAVVLVLATPLWAADVFAGHRKSGGFDLLMLTPLSNREVVFGALVGKLTGLAVLSLGLFPCLAVTGLLGGLDYGLLLEAAGLSLLTILYAGSVSIYFSAVSETLGAALRRTYVTMLALMLVPLGSPWPLWAWALQWVPADFDAFFACIGVALSLLVAATFLLGAVLVLRAPAQPVSKLRLRELAPPADAGERSFRKSRSAWLTPVAVVAAAAAIELARRCLVGLDFRTIPSLVHMASAFAVLALLVAIYFVLRGSCDNAWLDRRSGQADLILATPLSRFELLQLLVFNRPAIRLAAIYLGVATVLLLFDPASGAPAAGLALGILLYVSATGTWLLLVGATPRVAAASTFALGLAAFALPPLFDCHPIFVWGVAAVGATALLGLPHQPGLATAAVPTLLLPTLLLPPVGGGATANSAALSPAWWLWVLIRNRALHPLDSLRIRMDYESMFFALASLFAGALSWWLIWKRFDWLVDRPCPEAIPFQELARSRAERGPPI